MLFHLSWQSWFSWIISVAFVLWGLCTTICGLSYRSCKLVVMLDGFIYRDILKRESPFVFHYASIKEMSIQKKKVSLALKDGSQKTTDIDISETALQHLQNAYQAFKVVDILRAKPQHLSICKTIAREFR